MVELLLLKRRRTTELETMHIGMHSKFAYLGIEFSPVKVFHI